MFCLFRTLSLRAKLEYFGRAMEEIMLHSLAASGQSLRWAIIANPTAGGFTIRRRWKRHTAALEAAFETAQKNPLRSNAGPSPYVLSIAGTEWAEAAKSGLIPTSGPGRAMDITAGLMKEAETSGDFYLIITAGGDGTSLEVLEALYHAPAALRSRCAVLRLPLGTGNDGAEAWELADALALLIEPTHVEFTRGLKLTTTLGRTRSQSGKPLLAFNILSVGLDAFVTHMTNRMKGNLPGDSYKLWVDIAALLYDRIYRIGPMNITAHDENGKELRSLREKILLCAVGADGHRSYGSHKMILPDERNVCIVRQMPLLRKIALKGLFTTGQHINKPESILFNAHRIVFSGEHPILAQMDGETILLDKKDFPAVIELTAPVIPVLRK